MCVLLCGVSCVEHACLCISTVPSHRGQPHESQAHESQPHHGQPHHGQQDGHGVDAAFDHEEEAMQADSDLGHTEDDDDGFEDGDDGGDDDDDGFGGPYGDDDEDAETVCG